MSREAVNHVFNMDTGIFKVMYNFNDSGNNTLYSNSKAQAQFSGEIIGSSFFNINGSGNFSNAYVEFKNAENLNSNSFTHIFSYEKPYKGNAILFSSFHPDSAIKSGYQIGINDANFLFFQNFDNNGNRVLTFDKILAKKNIIAVKSSNNLLQFSYFNPNTREIESSSKTLNSSFILNSNDWFLGSGKDFSLNRFSGYMDEYLYFSSNISSQNLNKMISGTASQLTNYDPVTGYLTIVGDVTGYADQYYYETGIIGYTGNFDYQTGYASVPAYTWSGLTGNVEAGGIRYEFLEDLSVFCGEEDAKPIYAKIVVDSATTGITGIEKVLTGYKNVAQNPDVFFYSSGVTGFTNSGVYKIPLFETRNEEYIATGARTELTYNEQFIKSLYKDSITYKFNEDFSDFVEIQYGTGLNQVNINKNSTFNAGYGQFVLKAPSHSGGLIFYFNGLAQWASGASTTGTIYNQGLAYSGDIFVSGGRIYSQIPYNSSDTALYDYQITGNSKYVNITGESQYNGGYLADFPIEQREIYLNGQKLYSGVDYSGIGGNFAPIGDISGINGGLFSYFSRQNFVTETGKFSIYNINYANGTPILFLNGLREKTSDVLIQHSSSDYISGKSKNYNGLFTSKVYYNSEYGQNLLYWNQ